MDRHAADAIERPFDRLLTRVVVFRDTVCIPSGDAMHGDKKIGLALGILLVGIVGAFFFRNDTHELVNAPRMKDPEAIDELIAERSVAPYLTRRREMTQRPAETVRSRYVPESRSYELPEFLRDDPNSRTHELFGAPDPIPLSDRAGRERPKTETSVQPVFPEPIEPVIETESQIHTGEYTIQPDDTLSHLAERFLGSSSRYRDLYELNRDRLKSPNDLRPGKTIRIPQRITRARSIERSPERVSQRPVGRPSRRTVFAEPEPVAEQPRVPKKPTPPRRRRKLVLQSIGSPGAK
jgi:hypothetical protein